MPHKRYFTNPYLGKDISEKVFSPAFWEPIVSEYLSTTESKILPTAEEADGGLYTGCIGVGYMLYYLSKSELLSKQKRDSILNRSTNYCVATERYYSKKPPHCPTENYGFLLCRGGAYALGAVIYHASGFLKESEKCLKAYAECSDYCQPSYSQRFGTNEFFVGRAGYLTGLLWIQSSIGKVVLPKQKVHEICHCIVNEGRKYAEHSKSPAPLMYHYYHTEYLGAAHGVSSILLTLLSFKEFLTDYPQIEADIKTTVDYILSTQNAEGNFPSATNDNYYDLVHWCHGAPGVIYLMAKAYLHWKDEKYLKSCVKCADVIWHKGLLKKGPGICHGVAGNGYAFLLMYRLTNDKQYYNKAVAFAEFMATPEFKNGARVPDCPYSLYEGLAGTLCYFADLLNPNNASFPFMDVFYNYKY